MMRVAGYEFADGARFQQGANAKAAEVGEHLDLLRRQQHGELTPEDVVEDAKNANSPLHSFFEWSDSKAAHEHRLHQARGLIRSVVAVYVDDVKPAVRTRAFVHVPESSAPHYRSADHAMSQEKTRDMVLKQAWRELQGWRQRYRDLQEFADLIAVVDEIEQQLPATVRQ